jgi:hypothetical protein
MAKNKVTEPITDPKVGREQVLTRLWEIANLSPEQTRGSITGQIKALSMIVAIEGLIPDPRDDRRAPSKANEPAPRPAAPQIYPAAWRSPQPKTTEDRPSPLQENEPAVSESDPVPPATEPTPDPVSSVTVQPQSSPYPSFIPNTRRTFSLQNPFARR